MTYDYSDHTQTIESDGVSYVYQANYNNSPLKGKITVSGNDYSADYVYSARSDGLLAGSVYTFDNFGSGLTRTYTPTYNSKNQIVSETDGDFKAQYTYDAMGRMKIYEIHHGSRRVLTGQVYYGSNAVSGVRYTTNRVTGSSSDKSYGFDMLGRVNRVYWDRTTTDEINYDRYDRVSSYLIGGYNGTWYSYQYDDNNNLIHIKKRTPNGPPVTMPYIDFTYNSKNQLITYEVDNTTKYFSYDNLGNPVKYGVSSQSAAENMVWTQGTKLASGNYKGNSFSYKYDANGLRYEKTVNGITTRQYLEGDKIIAEEILNASGSVAHTKYYIYDQTGIAGMVYDGESYYFGKNIFGDVTTIYDCYGNWKASYEYDLWGNITSGGSSGIAKENPFRFRGYYYDSETGFYYLQSRYYDPEICRFINADNLELLSTLSGTPGQLNLYAYCNNNPVMYSDPSGCFWDYVFDLGFLIWDIVDIWKNPGNWANWVALGVDVVFAVVPFITSGAGKVIKVANVSDDIMDVKKVTIIGETMNRVKDTALLIGHLDDLYGGFNAYDKLKAMGKGGKVLAEIGGKASNIAWLYGKVRSGYTIVDIGIDISRLDRSSSYIAERIFLFVWQSRNVWKSFYHFGG